MKLRTVLFWTHLVAGVVAGAVILVMSVTGTLLTFQQSVLKVVERSQRFVEPPPGTSRLDVDSLLARVRAAIPDAQPTTITLDSDPRATVSMALGGTLGTVFVNPYTGQVLGSGSARVRGFYRTLTSWHRYLGVEGENRATARAITGACNAAFLVLAVTGLYLWWPRQWTARKVAAVMLFRRGLRGKARDFNWHNVIGVWCAPVLVILTATGMVISYTWASNLIYTVTGSPRPAVNAARGGAPAAGEQGRGGREQGTAPKAAAPQPQARSLATLESLVTRAAQQVPEWRTLIIRLPARSGGPVALSMSDRTYWNSFARSTLTLDGTTGADVRWEPYSQTSLGQKARGWMRFAHTGELAGLAGEAVAAVASAGGTVLVWTGITLALRRLGAWRGRRRVSDIARETPDRRVA